MPIMRNPFRKSASDIYTNETLPPTALGSRDRASKAEVYVTSSKPLSIKANGEPKQPTEYQLSEINDSGVFLPPSPPDTKSSFWSTRSVASTKSSSHRSVLNENEPFNISRESFDSYRRSFDISARSPVLEPASSNHGRQSFDARQLRKPLVPHACTSSPKQPKMLPLTGQVPESVRSGHRDRRPSASPYQPKILPPLPDDHINPPACEPDESEDALPKNPTRNESQSTVTDDSTAERFEEVVLGDDTATAKRFRQQHQPYQPYHPASKKAGIFSRFTGGASSDANIPIVEGASRPGSSGLGIGLGSHGFFGRKRGASGQGAELGHIHETASTAPTAPPGQEASIDN